ncbi:MULTISPECIES: SDR family NAD(P)-dependent oxidoreductase [unclassified Rhodococcus (in: high G+C Gram-positive bacteria)]|uniref:SDR family NAD(P)-dependent oxidoreductase n=1 Tax=unclassified Rhodococcus (in: high G+C Gram-positive bacteria) TaxID=192944 RepID=UPI00163B5701|nr:MULTISPECIES: SDR family oxidoreductase [unclassified Rhodococcus (in: high G+C Gram-positive bacteria)]MBC2637671.1 SDR family oxidoreductase [Rhodococcus sp. 3A]MBC2897585.1 SDR family oxidoreductase [Rhodococcus sp. 4CII]
MGRVEGRIAIVTGATSVEPGGLNIGGAAATELAAEGAGVVLADINVEGAERLAAILNERHGEKTALAFGLDLRNESEIEQLVARTLEYFGRPDIVINNAGIFPIDDGDVATMGIETWDNVMATNVRAAMLLTKHALPHLREGGGAIVNTASTHAFAGDSSLTGYGAAKAALLALTKYTATQYGKEGVRANAICPGTTTTPPAQALPEAIKDVYRAHTMSPDLNGPTELGKVYLFLASDDAKGINGEVVRVDGGLLAHQPFVPDMVMMGMTTASEQ